MALPAAVPCGPHAAMVASALQEALATERQEEMVYNDILLCTATLSCLF